MTDDPAGVVRSFWERIEARDWDGMRALLAEDVVFDWRHSLERFRGRENVVGMNRAYPEGWRIEVLQVLSCGDRVVSEVRVPFLDEAVFFVASIFEVRDGLIGSAVEYWIKAGHEAAPDWRRPFTEP
jgi:ketosteroid isomerase-like protein